MADSDPRCLPLVEVELDQIQSLLYPVLKGSADARIDRVEGGLVNTLYRVTPSDGSVSLCVRIFAAGRVSWETERRILAQISASLPVPDVLMSGRGNSYNALAIGFGPTERTSDVIFSIALYPRWVSLFFFHGVGLPDPQKLLKGSGKTVRHIVLESAQI